MGVNNMGKKEPLEVTLVPMPSGDNPWKTREEYLQDRRQENSKFIMYIVIAAFSVLGQIAAIILCAFTISKL
jgi:hypothetical protein